MQASDYPKEVEQVIESIYESLTQDGFFIEHEIQERGKDALVEVAGPILMKGWVKGSLTETIDDYETLKDILARTVAVALIMEMKDKKLIDTIEDENGEEIVFLTEKGKQVKAENDKQKNC